MPRPVLRFAPSPNGHLHLGHALSALLNATRARATDGRLLLRIEDIDEARCPPRLVDEMIEDLAWLGLVWEEPVRRQSRHLADYGAALDRLDGMGLLYASYATRGEIASAVARAESATGRPWPRDPDGAPLHPGPWLEGDRDAGSRPDGARSALRLDMARALAGVAPLAWGELDRGGHATIVAADPAAWGDVVLRRKDIPASYHVAVVVDDALQGVTEIIRGRDLYHATAVHRLLQHLLGLPEPLYCHHDLILGTDGTKLSKSLASTSLRDLRRDGLTPADVRRLVGV